MVNNSKWGKTAALVTGALLVGGLAGGFYASDNDTVDRLTADLATANAAEPTTVIEEVTVEVDNGNLDLVLQRIFDDEGEVSYLTNSLDDDEVSEIANRVVFVNEVKSLAVKAVKADLFDEIDRLEVDGTDVKLDEDDLEKLRIDDDDDELEFQIDDWDDRDATVHVKWTFEQDDDKFDFELDVVFENGEFDELENIDVTEHA